MAGGAAGAVSLSRVSIDSRCTKYQAQRKQRANYKSSDKSFEVFVVGSGVGNSHLFEVWCEGLPSDKFTIAESALNYITR